MAGSGAGTEKRPNLYHNYPVGSCREFGLPPRRQTRLLENSNIETTESATSAPPPERQTANIVLAVPRAVSPPERHTPTLEILPNIETAESATPASVQHPVGGARGHLALYWRMDADVRNFLTARPPTAKSLIILWRFPPASSPLYWLMDTVSSGFGWCVLCIPPHCGKIGLSGNWNHLSRNGHDAHHVSVPGKFGVMDAGLKTSGGKPDDSRTKSPPEDRPAA